MRLRTLPVALLLASILWLVAAPAAAQTAAEDACFGQPVVAIDLRVTGHSDYPQTPVASIALKLQQPFTREANKRSIERLIRLSGFERVWVTCDVGGGGAHVTYHADPPYPVNKLVFAGNTGLTSQQLEDKVKARYTGMPVGVEPELVNDAVKIILADNGYMDATSSVTRETFEDPDRATLTFQIEAGPLALLNEIQLDNPNQDAITNARLRTALGLFKNDPYRPGPMRDALGRIVNDLKAKGYYTADGFVEPGRPVGDHRFDVKVTLAPGPLITLEWDRQGDEPPAGDINDFVPIKAQNSIDRDLLTDSMRRIEARLSNEGFADAKAVIVPGEDTPERRVLKVHVTRGPKYRIDHVQFPENLHISDRELETLLQASDGDDYRGPRVNAGLARIRARYNERGFYRAIVLPGDNPPAPNRPQTAKEKWIVLQPQIIEGPQGHIVKVVFDRKTAEVSEGILLAVMQGKVGEYFQTAFNVADRIAIETKYLDLGYRFANVTSIEPQFSADGTEVTRIVHLVEGPQVIVADIQIVGWHDISERAIREELTLHPGEAFSEAKRLESQTRLYNIGVFRQVTIDVDPDNPLGPTDTAAHLVVRVVESPDTTLTFGAGVEGGRKARSAVGGGLEDRLEFGPSASFEISRRNLGGRNRTIDFATRGTLRPRDVPGDPARDGHGYTFSEYRAALSYRERRAFRTDTDWFFTLTSEQAIRTTFNFIRNAGNVDFVRRLTARTTANLGYTIDFTRLFDQRFVSGTIDETLPIDRAFPQVRLSTFSFSVLTDRRDDAVAPKRGVLGTMDLEIAGRAIGSEVGYMKAYFQGSTYRKLDQSGRFVFATRGVLGVARGFERPITLPDGTPGTVADLPAAIRFFAGGGTTVRGYQLDRLGTPEVLTIDGLSLGGNGLVIGNAELRTAVGKLFGRKFTVVEFADAGNVFKLASDISLARLRASLGFGFRYDSPVGSIRLDFGHKLSQMTFGDGSSDHPFRREHAWEYHISFGEVF